MNEIRRFENTDWYTWGGATRFNNGSDPFIYEKDLDDSTSLTMIGDETGISIYIFAGEDEPMEWFYNNKMCPTRIEGRMRAIARFLENFTNAPDISFILDSSESPEIKGFCFTEP